MRPWQELCWGIPTAGGVLHAGRWLQKSTRPEQTHGDIQHKVFCGNLCLRDFLNRELLSTREKCRPECNSSAGPWRPYMLQKKAWQVPIALQVSWKGHTKHSSTKELFFSPNWAFHSSQTDTAPPGTVGTFSWCCEIWRTLPEQGVAHTAVPSWFCVVQIDPTK